MCERLIFKMAGGARRRVPVSRGRNRNKKAPRVSPRGLNGGETTPLRDRLRQRHVAPSGLHRLGYDADLAPALHPVRDRLFRTAPSFC